MNNVRKARVARGFHPENCSQCRTGLGAGQIKLFDPQCEGCHEKKAKGLRTGNEPAPSRRMGEKLVDHERVARQRAARAEAKKASPLPRGGQ